MGQKDQSQNRGWVLGTRINWKRGKTRVSTLTYTVQPIHVYRRTNREVLQDSEEGVKVGKLIKALHQCSSLMTRWW